MKEGKRKVDKESSNEDSPSSMNGVDHTEKEWTTNAGGNWRGFSWAFGLDGSSSSVARRRGRRGPTARKGKGGGGGSEKDPMQELLELVLWNGEKEIDITEELADDYDSDEEDLEAIKRSMAREQTIRPRAAIGVSRMESGGKKRSEEGGEGEGKMNRVSSSGLSVSNLRFESLLKIGSTAESSKKSSILRLEQRTNTMEQAFKGVLDDSYICEATSSSTQKADLSTRTVFSATIVAGAEGGGEENFWDDVEF
ncbi:hypothetical protein PENTCL1PPCAC_1372 [Pristionchus entomophagus]|uniref:Uncharacterized protein n=1 Tax=Pristionchus entomophagus TaxID=358040 RepID=A0AAV5S882_9BILA|nr:hypothetical protein PENTCL1PPCAC_1372 [Pristionchus entomophagus]